MPLSDQIDATPATPNEAAAAAVHAVKVYGEGERAVRALDDVTVSRRHAIFRRTPEGFVVRDVGSLNGTYVNRELVEAATLTTGDEVQIGKFRLVFYASQA